MKRVWPLVLVLLILFSGSAYSEERILDYHSDIEVFPDGAMQVTETIRVRAARQDIKRGIYRDFPTDYRDRFGNRYRVGFDVIDVRRDGRPEGWHTQSITDGVRVYMGRKEVSLESGDYTYALTYRTNRQLGFFDDHDELYWNVTGNFWHFPIDKASATVVLPPDVPAARITCEAYTGPRGAQGQDYTATVADDGTIRFATTRPFAKGEGLTIVVSWPKGSVHEPTARETLNFVLQDNRSWLILLVGLAALLAYYLVAWVLVGRDPEAGLVITRYEPPVGVTPATARFIVRMGYDHKTFASAVVNLAVKGLVEITQEGRHFTLQRTDRDTDGLAPGENAILKHLFGNRKGASIVLQQAKHATIRKALKAHEAALQRNNEKIFFLRNRVWLIPGMLISLLIYAGVIYGLPGPDLKMTGLFLSIWLTFWTLGVFTLGRKVWSAWRQTTSLLPGLSAIFITLFSLPFFAAEVFVAGLLATQVSATLPAALVSAVIINVTFHHLLKAPTRTGRRLLDQLDGFRQFLDVAERDEMNFRNPPEKTPELFERYLPYALALDVEQHWMERFAGIFKRLEQRGASYRPLWYHGQHWQVNNLGGFSASLGKSLGAAVGSSATAPGSSSGSGGGGSSGGGGGGGGGGGW
ncbi:MAG: DUF2207 domain-containing protein [Desulfuromonadales bacterium]